MTFRYKPGIGVPYEQQGLIYFTSLLYAEQPERVKNRINALCRECGGDHWEALFEFVTGTETATEICRRHYVGRSTLYRSVQRYYQRFAKSM